MITEDFPSAVKSDYPPAELGAYGWKPLKGAEFPLHAKPMPRMLAIPLWMHRGIWVYCRDYSVMRTGPELILATKQYAEEIPARSWWALLSTTFLLAAALAGTVWNFHWTAKLACSVLSGLLMIRLFVIYHDQQHHAILTALPVGRWVHARFRRAGAEPEQRLASLAQPSSQSQLEAARLAHRLLSDHDDGPVSEVVAQGTTGCISPCGIRSPFSSGI